MKKEEINRAIAEYCGWEFHPSKDDSNGNAYPEYWDKDGMQYFGDAPYPNYYEDLNAMHKAEECFDNTSIDKQSHYYDLLSLICGWESETVEEAKWESTWNTLRATAQQKSEALLRTLGKWKE
jgi:hypothetical protein